VNTLNSIGDVFVRMFLQANIITVEDLKRQRLVDTKDATDIKWHVTLLNSKYAARGSKVSRPTINSKKLIEDFHDFDFGKIKLEEIHLSVLDRFDNNDYYKCIEKIRLP